MAEDLSPLEHKVIATILAPDHPVINALRRQFERCHVASRQMTGVGFFTDLDIGTDFEPAPVKPGRIFLQDVTATIEGLERGAGFVLFVQDGVLDFLEGFSYDEPWPDARGRYQVSAAGEMHFAESESDIERVNATWDRSGDRLLSRQALADET